MARIVTVWVKKTTVLATISLALLTSGVVCSADKPGPFVFMYGLQGPQSAATALELGLNTLYWQLTSDDLENLPQIRREIAQAAAQNLSVIVALPTAPGIPRSVSLADEEYLTATKAVITKVVSTLKEEPGLTGWATSDYLEGAINYTSTEFRDYLQQRYGSLDELNRVWNCAYSTWGQITLEAAEVADDDLPFGVGRPSVDVAQYKRQTFQSIMAFWAEQIRALDPDRLLFTGRIGLYRSLTAIPDEYDVVVPAIPVEAVEPETYTYNVEAVDMARRSGRFVVIPALSMPMPPDPTMPPMPSDVPYAQHALRHWIVEAGLHGAAGIGLEDYQRIINLPMPMGFVKRIREDLEAVTNEVLFAAQPRPTVAFLYEPYAEGLAVDKIPVYGYISGFSQGEPNNLFAAFRGGSRFGLVDYLTVQDLLSRQVDLDHYSFIAAPLALHLPPPALGQLEEYVEGGGVVIADLGAGMYQTGSYQLLPAELGRMCGVEAMGHMQEQVTNMSIGVACRHFPSLPPPLRTRGRFTAKTRVKQGTPLQRKPYTLSGPLGYAAIHADAVPLAVSRVVWDEGTPYFGGIIVKDYALGVGVFATSRLWANWHPDDPVFIGFHADLWARRADYELPQPGFWPQGIEIWGAGDTVYLLDTTGNPLTAAAVAYRADSRLYDGAWCEFSAAARWPSGKRSGAALVTVTLPPLQITATTAKPVQIQPYAGEAVGRLWEYGPDRVRLEIAGAGARLFRSPDGDWQLSPGQPTVVRVTVGSGLYPIAPLSWHQVEIDAGFARRSTQRIQADPHGKLRFDAAGQRATVEICPAT